MVIEIEGLKKSFKEVKALDDLSFAVKEGELFAFLGVNGAGKSTTINIISGVLNKDSGRVLVCGENIDERPGSVKGKIGIVFQNSVLDKNMTVKENLKSRAALYGIFGKDFDARYAELDEMLSLKEIEKRLVGKLSGGQRRRADVARALLHGPELLILDEPTTGLDPKTRLTVWEVVERFRKERGMTVFLTTHYMEEAAVADYVVILDAGKKAAEGTPHDLKNKYANDFIRFYSRLDEVEQKLKDFPLVRRRDHIEAEISSTAAVPALISEFPELFLDFEVAKGNMDNVFLKVTGKNIEEA